VSEASLKERARKELRNYAIVAAYLYVCFGAILLYKTALLREEGVAFLPHGLAAIKALILGKFILIGEAVGVGERARPQSLLSAIASSTALYFVLLVVLSIVEELIVGKVHGHSLAQTVAEFREHAGLELLATSFLMLLILIPLIAFKELRQRKIL
jgi:Na+-transporting NADH:ubiquinone oxidoreductase subunit NqrD